MEQRIRHLRRSVCLAGLIACTGLAIAFAGMAWLEARAAAQRSDAALDSAIGTIEDMTVAARSEAFERLAIAARQVNVGLHDAGNRVPLDTAMAQGRLDAATYITGVATTLVRLQSGHPVVLAGSPRHGDAGRDRGTDIDVDTDVAAELRNGHGWSRILQRNGEWLGVSYRALEAPYGDVMLRLETPLPLRELERYLDALAAPDAFVVLHDTAGLVRLRTSGAPDAVSIDQIEPLLNGQGWVRRERRLGDTELSVLAAYRPIAGARRPLALCASGFACAILSGLLLLRYAWRRTTVEAIAPLHDIARLAADLQRGHNTYALTQCGRRDDVGVLAGAVVQLVHERTSVHHDRVPRAVGAGA